MAQPPVLTLDTASAHEDVWRLRQRQIENQKRVEQERREQERLEQERLEQERIEQERIEQERIERERIEQERIKQERIKELIEQERIQREQERIERERIQREQERIKELIEQERIQREQERIERERIQREQEQERLEQEQLDQLKKQKGTDQEAIQLRQGDACFDVENRKQAAREQMAELLARIPAIFVEPEIVSLSRFQEPLLRELGFVYMAVPYLSIQAIMRAGLATQEPSAQLLLEKLKECFSQASPRLGSPPTDQTSEAAPVSPLQITQSPTQPTPISVDQPPQLASTARAQPRASTPSPSKEAPSVVSRWPFRR